MAELADALDSGSSGATRTGSSPATRTSREPRHALSRTEVLFNFIFSFTRSSLTRYEHPHQNRQETKILVDFIF